MKNLLFGTLIGVALAACSSQKSGASSGDTAYACPMHPEVTGNKGDKCPKCGMVLQPVK